MRLRDIDYFLERLPVVTSIRASASARASTRTRASSTRVTASECEGLSNFFPELIGP